jgi:hypothetical protein
MKKDKRIPPAEWEARPEYDFTSAERGRHHRRYHDGVRILVKDDGPDEDATPQLPANKTSERPRTPR